MDLWGFMYVCWLCINAKHIYMATTWLRKTDKEKITYGSRCNEIEIAFCIMGKVDGTFLKNVKVITGELQHDLAVVDVDGTLK